jgi:hypothetical protein
MTTPRLPIAARSVVLVVPKCDERIDAAGT